MSDLLKLAERCEVATGPDRQLNYSLAEVAGWKLKGQGWEAPGKPGDYRLGVPAYTASLDAAMTLVDDQLVTLVMREALDRLDECFNPLDNYLTKLRLFVCAAALRARAAQ